MGDYTLRAGRKCSIGVSGGEPTAAGPAHRYSSCGRLHLLHWLQQPFLCLYIKLYVAARTNTRPAVAPPVVQTLAVLLNFAWYLVPVLTEGERTPCRTCILSYKVGRVPRPAKSPISRQLWEPPTCCLIWTPYLLACMGGIPCLRVKSAAPTPRGPGAQQAQETP